MSAGDSMEIEISPATPEKEWSPTQDESKSGVYTWLYVQELGPHFILLSLDIDNMQYIHGRTLN